jgi:transcriptional regulator with XRE-family HTH domain
VAEGDLTPTPTVETLDTRVELGLTRASFAKLLGVRPAQVRKWETPGQPDPSNAALAAMRLALRLHELERNPLPWMTDELWATAHIASNELRAMAEQTHTRADYRTFCHAIQVLRALLEQQPKKV